MVPNEHKKIDSIGTVAASFVIWCLSIPVNAIPLYLKYITDKSTILSLHELFCYIMADKECTFIFVAVGIMLLLEGNYCFYKGKRWENAVSFLIRILTVILLFTLILIYIPNVINEAAWLKNQEQLVIINTGFLIATFLLGVFGHVFICVRKMVGDD